MPRLFYDHRKQGTSDPRTLGSACIKGVLDDLAYISSVEERDSWLYLWLHQPLKPCPLKKWLQRSSEFRMVTWPHLPCGMPPPGLSVSVGPGATYVPWVGVLSCRDTFVLWCSYNGSFNAYQRETVFSPLSTLLVVRFFFPFLGGGR